MTGSRKETPSQTAGPFLHIGMVPAIAGLQTDSPDRQNILIRTDSSGERIRIEGQIYDGADALVKDALVEIWQADANGRYDGNTFPSWGRAATDFVTGVFSFETIKPGPIPFHDQRPQAPHVSLTLFARGINLHLQTRMYFADEEVANATDPVLQMLGDAQLTRTLMGHRQSGGAMPIYRFNIYLQGARETVFFDI
jgi:protocatechuate 3,4-dioxygenase, alpha subunit